jgi:hypothetical protein
MKLPALHTRFFMPVVLCNQKFQYFDSNGSNFHFLSWQWFRTGSNLNWTSWNQFSCKLWFTFGFSNTGHWSGPGSSSLEKCPNWTPATLGASQSFNSPSVFGSALLKHAHAATPTIRLKDMNQSLGYAQSVSTILDAWPQIACQQILASRCTMRPGQLPSKRYNHARL